MRRYYIISVILLTLPIIDFAVAAPVLQKKHQAGVDVVHIPGHSITMLGKRFSELSELWPELFRGSGKDLAKLEDFAKPESSSAARPSSSSHPSEPADGRTDLRQPPPSIPEEPFPESSLGHVPPGPSDAWWHELFDDSETGTESETGTSSETGTESETETKSETGTESETGTKSETGTESEDPEDYLATSESSASGSPEPPTRSPQTMPADGWTNLKEKLPTIPEEPSPVSSPDHASPSPGDKTKALWLELFGDSESPSAERPSSSSPPSRTADEGTDLKQHSPSIPEGPSPVGSLTGYELMKGDVPPGPSGPASPAMSSADHELMGAHEPPPGPSTESDHEMVDVSPSNPVTSTNPYSQWMGSGSPSSGKRKRPW